MSMFIDNIYIYIYMHTKYAIQIYQQKHIQCHVLPTNTSGEYGINFYQLCQQDFSIKFIHENITWPVRIDQSHPVIGICRVFHQVGIL